MSTSKTPNIFVYPTQGPVLTNSGALLALNLGGDPVLDNMAPPWVPKCMFIKHIQTILILPCFSSQTRQACHPNDANFPFNLQVQGSSHQEAIPITREIGFNCGRLKTCKIHSSCTSVRGPQALEGNLLDINVWLMHMIFPGKHSAGG